MAGRYAEIEPYEHGMLDVGDGNLMYWEACGNPAGKPALVVHGGPGSGCRPGMRQFFDPDRYRIILFDQRGCGRSRPHASDPDTDLSTNTTWHLLADMELLRERLAVERWLLLGSSWGAVLSLVYAQRHPERVCELVLFGVATGRRAETDLLTRGLGRIFPQAWARFREPVPAADRDGDLAAAYCRLLNDPDPRVRSRAARDWCDWEIAILPTSPPHQRYESPRFRLAFARLVTHYWANGSWLPEGMVLGQAGKLAGIPGVMIQGTLDLGNLLGAVAAGPGLAGQPADPRRRRRTRRHDQRGSRGGRHNRSPCRPFRVGRNAWPSLLTAQMGVGRTAGATHRVAYCLASVGWRP